MYNNDFNIRQHCICNVVGAARQVHQFVVFILFSLIIIKGLANNCAQRKYDDGIVCVCNSTFCDYLPQLDSIIAGTYQVFTSNEDGLRFEKSNGSLSEGSPLNLYKLAIDRSKKHQTIFGYGGAFTDSTGLNIASLSKSTQSNLLNSYFSKSGSEYTFGRVPIAGTDFSTRFYTYADEGNGTLDNFALQYEDYNYKVSIPQIYVRTTVANTYVLENIKLSKIKRLITSTNVANLQELY